MQLAAAAAKKVRLMNSTSRSAQDFSNCSQLVFGLYQEQEEKERKAVIKEEREQRRIAAVERKQAEERERAEADRKARAAEVDRKKKERDESSRTRGGTAVKAKQLSVASVS